MGKVIQYAFYQLNPNASLNARSSAQERFGVLLRVGDSMADYHPWTELGDRGIEEFLDTWKTSPDEYTLSTIALAKEMRWDFKRSSFLNHGLNQNSTTSVCKIKLKQDPCSLNDRLNSQKIRIDANATLPIEIWKEWWEELSEKQKANVDYVEDPMPFDESSWAELSELGIPLAADFEVGARSLSSVQVVYKPNREWPNFESQSYIYSSYMGHDVGRVCAYFALVGSGSLELTHGIHTPGLYQEQFDLFDLDGDKCTPIEGDFRRVYREACKLDWKVLGDLS